MRKGNIINYKNPSQNLVTDVLSEFLRESAQKMLSYCQMLCMKKIRQHIFSHLSYRY